jgi:hypothetical protein
MKTHLQYGDNFQYIWNGARQHLKFNELGTMEIPVQGDFIGKYSLIAENTKKLQKEIYAAIEVDDFTGMPYFYTRTISNKKFVMIPIPDEQTADGVFYIWEEALKRKENFVAATQMIIDRVVEM